MSETIHVQIRRLIDTQGGSICGVKHCCYRAGTEILREFFRFFILHRRILIFEIYGYGYLSIFL